MDLQAIANGQTTYTITQIRSNTTTVRSLQSALNLMGFPVGPVDGVWGPRTEAAYREFTDYFGFRPNELSPRVARFIINSTGMPPAPPPAPPPPAPPPPAPPPPAPPPAPPPTTDHFREALQFSLRWEGGFVDHPADPGGATNKGITTATYNTYRRNKGLPLRSVRLITDEEVEDIYRNMYWTPSNSRLMVRPLAIVHFDTAVNFGVGGATLFLQETLGVPADGGFGPVTRAALDRANTVTTARRYVQNRIDYRYLRVRQSPSQQVFLNGWLNRDNDLMNYISRM
jgi:lysozyme family protein